MTLRYVIVSALDERAPRLMGLARYVYHVHLKGNVVYPEVTGRLFARMGSHDLQAIDVGANVGIFSRHLGRHFRRCHAFEPVPYLADRLRRSLPASCLVHPIALGDDDGEIVLRIPVDHLGRQMHALTTAAAANTLGLFGNAGVVEIPTRQARLDTVLAGADDIGFVKIDVEGFEDAVLRGATRLLNDVRPVVQMEIARAHNPDHAATVERMRAAGYLFFAITDTGLLEASITDIERQPTDLSLVGCHSAEATRALWDFVFVPEEKSALVEGMILSRDGRGDGS